MAVMQTEGEAIKGILSLIFMLFLSFNWTTKAASNFMNDPVIRGMNDFRLKNGAALGSVASKCPGKTLNRLCVTTATAINLVFGMM